MRQVERLFRDVVLERDLQAAVDVRHILQPALNHVGVELRRLENLGVRLEIDLGAVAAKRTELLQLRRDLAALERLLPLETVAANRGDKFLRQRVDHRRTDAVQTAGVNVSVALAELGPECSVVRISSSAGRLCLGCMSTGMPRPLSTTVTASPFFVQRDGDRVGEAVDVLVDGVIDDLPHE